ncbi:PQQ-binding-like beta-propeller repeat protein [Paenibacillus tianjinensis]|uniref:PQQ-binding-like beta-propeller repeat protein n=1 Tax=Paenibacillus tianjinensis TaxID=2810347 RepID=A0ABX7L423_9BACL|nr:PQQ-binding-like beta-propeller repeat protein [Paenibacillus tianjinensis]QSF42560.1 PQQ-binding-like beta-propeller repeat protein [Paenibacillus tianjinensis]
MSKFKLGFTAFLASGLLVYSVASITDARSSIINPLNTRAVLFAAAKASPSPKPAAIQVRWQAKADGGGFSAGKQPVSNGVIYYSTNNILYAKNISTGKLLWSYRNAANPQIVTNNSVFVFANSDHLLKISATTGKLIWKVKVAQLPMEVGGQARLINGKVIFANERGGIIAYNPVSGKKLWENPKIPMYAGSLYGEYKGVLVVSSTVDNIRSQYYGLDPETGKQLWRTEGIYDLISVDGGNFVLQKRAGEQYKTVTAPVPGHLLTLVQMDPATGKITGEENYQPLDDVRRIGSFYTFIQKPYTYAASEDADQSEISLTRFTRGQGDSASKSYDGYGSWVAGPVEGMVFFQQCTKLTGVNLTDDRIVTFITPSSKIVKVEKKDHYVFASYEDGSFSVMDAESGASLGQFNTGLSYTYFGNIAIDNGTALIRFESKLFAVSLPK